MLYRDIVVVVTTIFMTVAALSSKAGTLNEVDYGEFGDTFNSPTDFTGYSTITGSSNNRQDYEYFWFDSLIAGTTSLDFSLVNGGSGSNMLIRLSATPFTMPEWDWKIEELDSGNMQARELYANKWMPRDSYSFVVPDQFTGPLYGFARFYGTNSDSSFTINAVGAQTDVGIVDESSIPLPGTLFLMLAALASIGVTAVTRRM